MKKLLSFILGVCLIIPCAFMFTGCKDKEPQMETWDGTTIEVSAADENGVILIETAEELAGLAKEVNEGNTFAGKTIKLACDMDLTNKEWTPIGYGSFNNNTNTVNAGYVFKGTFDGQNHTLHNLKITTFVGGASENNYSATGIGLFGSNLGTIKNLKVDEAVVKGNHFVAVIAGFNAGAIIENCHVEDAEVSCTYLDEDESGDKAGVIAGYVGNSSVRLSEVKNCTAEDSTVNAARDAGQIVGCVASACQQNIVNNIAEEVLVTDNNQTQNTTNNDNIKNEVVGRIS